MLNIKILGSGCTNCKNLEKLCREVVIENKLEANIEKVTDFKEIASYGIMSTAASSRLRSRCSIG